MGEKRYAQSTALISCAVIVGILLISNNPIISSSDTGGMITGLLSLPPPPTATALSPTWSCTVPKVDGYSPNGVSNTGEVFFVSSFDFINKASLLQAMDLDCNQLFMVPLPGEVNDISVYKGVLWLLKRENSSNTILQKVDNTFSVLEEYTLPPEYSAGSSFFIEEGNAFITHNGGNDFISRYDVAAGTAEKFVDTPDGVLQGIAKIKDTFISGDRGSGKIYVIQNREIVNTAVDDDIDHFYLGYLEEINGQLVSLTNDGSNNRLEVVDIEKIIPKTFPQRCTIGMNELQPAGITATEDRLVVAVQGESFTKVVVLDHECSIVDEMLMPFEAEDIAFDNGRFYVLTFEHAAKARIHIMDENLQQIEEFDLEGSKFTAGTSLEVADGKIFVTHNAADDLMSVTNLETRDTTVLVDLKDAAPRGIAAVGRVTVALDSTLNTAYLYYGGELLEEREFPNVYFHLASRKNQLWGLGIDGEGFFAEKIDIEIPPNGIAGNLLDVNQDNTVDMRDTFTELRKPSPSKFTILESIKRWI